MRTEKDFTGEIEIPDDALYGIHSLRAANNFPNTTPFNQAWYQAIGLVKQACYQTALSFVEAASKKYTQPRLPAGCQSIEKLQWLEECASEIALGAHFEHFIVPALQGGAGTAINMNVNEIICNASLLKQGLKAGDYHELDPFIHANIFQSTNDVIPTALRVALMKEFNQLETGINALRSAMEKQESAHRGSLRIGYTQMQQAVPSSFGLLFSAWTDALSRDWWRVSKCFERIKVCNLGGGATGTAMGIPRYFVMEVVNKLRHITQLPLTRSENHSDTTQNLDVFVEVHAILKAHAVNLEKITSDLRLLGSDIVGQYEVKLPRVQTGSSIMPGKVNPVINEYVISISHKVYANDMLISNLCGQGSLELNPYLPTIGNALLESLQLLISANRSLLENLIVKLQVHSHTAWEKLIHSPAITTALLPLLGYAKATELVNYMHKEKVSIHQANEALKLLAKEKLEQVLQAENLLKLGYSLNEL